MANKELVENILNFDPVGDAEERFGRNTDEAFGAGLLNVHAKRNALEAAMLENRDTYRNMPYEDYLSVAEEIGFECVLNEDFLAKDYGDYNYRKENHRVYWKRDEGLVLVVNSYTYSGKPSVNRATLFYNVELTPGWNKRPWAFSSGTGCKFDFEDPDSPCEVWKGSSHVEDALRHKIEKLREVGKLMPEWYEAYHPYFDHYGNKENRDYSKINDLGALLRKEWKQYNKKLPSDLREMINQSIDREVENDRLDQEARRSRNENRKSL